jgi:lipocalin-like protein
MRGLPLALIAILFSLTSAIADDDFPGTYKLVSGTRTIVETGEVKDAYGKNPKGYIMYGRDGRMLVLITHDDRPKPSRTDMTDQDRADQYRTLNTYGGTYTFRGNSVEHHIDIAGNETRVRSNEVREVKRDGDRLIYTTKPQPFSADGKLSVITLIWEKLK